MLGEMTTNRAPPNAVSYESVVKAMCNGGEPVRAYKIVAMMEAADGSKRILPTPSTYNILLCSLVEKGRWSKVVDVVDRMEQHEILGVGEAVDAAVEAVERGGHWEAALSLLERLQATEEAYSAVMAALGSSRRWGAAVEVLDAMPEDLRCISTVNSAITALGYGGLWEKALEVFESLDARRLRANDVTFARLITCLDRGDQWDKAVAMEAQMQEAHGVQPTEQVYIALLQAHASGHQWEEALRLLSEMRSRGIPPTTTAYHAAIHACRGGAWEPALKLMHEMEGQTQ